MRLERFSDVLAAAAGKTPSQGYSWPSQHLTGAASVRQSAEPPSRTEVRSDDWVEAVKLASNESRMLVQELRDDLIRTRDLLDQVASRVGETNPAMTPRLAAAESFPVSEPAGTRDRIRICALRFRVEMERRVLDSLEPTPALAVGAVVRRKAQGQYETIAWAGQELVVNALMQDLVFSNSMFDELASGEYFFLLVGGSEEGVESARRKYGELSDFLILGESSSESLSSTPASSRRIELVYPASLADYLATTRLQDK